jgi:hypothetical protein
VLHGINVRFNFIYFCNYVSSVSSVTWMFLCAIVYLFLFVAGDICVIYLQYIRINMILVGSIFLDQQKNVGRSIHNLN